MKEKRVICAVDIETTGMDWSKHQILQVAIVPLDSGFNVCHDMIIDIRIRAGRGEIDPKAMEIHKLDPNEGIDEYDFPVFLKRKMYVFGIDKIEPLGCFYDNFDYPFLADAIDRHEEQVGTYRDLFSSLSRDVMKLAQSINDRYTANGHQPLFRPYYGADGKEHSGLSLKDICKTLEIAHSWPHDAVEDAIAAARAYKALLDVM